MGVVVPNLHRLQQGVVVETEVWICQRVEGSEVQPLEGNQWSIRDTCLVPVHNVLMDVCEHVFRRPTFGSGPNGSATSPDSNTNRQQMC